jgi:hypothetical protein
LDPHVHLLDEAEELLFGPVYFALHISVAHFAPSESRGKGGSPGSFAALGWRAQRATDGFLSEAGLITGSRNDVIIDLSGAHLEGAHLEGAYLSGAYLSGAHLRGAYLRGAHLSGAYLRGAHLHGAHLSSAHLSYADLRDAHLSGAHLSSAHLRGADLSYADLSYAKVTQTQLNEAKSLQGTIMPDGSKHP